VKLELLARLVAAKCPNCGAGLTVPPVTDWVTCGYCHVSSFVQRSRSHAPAAPPLPTGTPVIHVQQSRSAVWIVLVLVATVSVIIAVVAFEHERRLASTAFVKPPVLYDVNDDGAEDVLIAAVNVSGPSYYLRALDANTGSTLWKTDYLGQDVDHIAMAGDAVLWITPGKVRGFDARTGVERFIRDLPERATGVCEAGRSWLLLTADEKAHAIDPASGVLTPSPLSDASSPSSSERSCSPTSSTFAPFGRLVRTDDSPDVRVEGMTTSKLLHFGAETLPALALGRRAEGSEFPMLAAVRDERTLWKLELASTAPLEVFPGDPRAATIAAGRVYATYNRSSTRAFTVVAITLSSGERLWEAAVPRESYAGVTLHASDRHVFARAETSLYALSATDGRVLWRVGWDTGAQ
jgi:ribosomal protein S27AE